jgi:hypothetical protein
MELSYTALLKSRLVESWHTESAQFYRSWVGQNKSLEEFNSNIWSAFSYG